MQLNTIPELLDDIKSGQMVVVMDDEDRENEGDLIMAASKVTPEAINFMARYGRGLICLPLTRERCQQLRLGLMVNENHARFATNFTVSIEAAEGITTGISAYDRAHTIRTAVQPDAGPEDISQPGHVFPLMSQPAGFWHVQGTPKPAWTWRCLPVSNRRRYWSRYSTKTAVWRAVPSLKRLLPRTG